MLLKNVKSLTALLLTLSLFLAMVPHTASAASAPAPNITLQCKFAPQTGCFTYAIDGNFRTFWTSSAALSRNLTITLPSACGGLYFDWNLPPSRWELFALRPGKAPVSVVSGGKQRWLTQYAPIPASFGDCRQYRLVMTTATSVPVSIAELSVFGPGAAPPYAPQWKDLAPGDRVDVLTFAAHPDDEDLYLSVPAVTYGAQGKKTATAFMTYGPPSTSVRRFEAQESCWCLGNRYYPPMAHFIDVKTSTAEAQMKYWPLDSVLSYMVEQIRRFRPAVIVTHDVMGEYWHGGHRLTEYGAALAIKAAADPTKYPSSAKKYGTWRAAKLYVHLYRGDELNTMSLTATLPAFGNRTVLQVIQNAYSRHKSQLPGGRSLPTSGMYDMRKFGLLYTNVGADAAHNTMFEHVSLDTMLKLNPWYNSVVADRSALKKALADARSKQEPYFSAKSWAAADLPDVIAAAEACLNDPTSTQAKIDAYTAALQAAIAKLEPADVADLKIAHPATKQVYRVGEPLDLTGLVVTATYEAGAQPVEVKITADDVSGFDSSKPAADQVLTIAYGGKTVSYTVNIVEKQLVK